MVVQLPTPLLPIKWMSPTIPFTKEIHPGTQSFLSNFEITSNFKPFLNAQTVLPYHFADEINLVEILAIL